MHVLNDRFFVSKINEKPEAIINLMTLYKRRIIDVSKEVAKEAILEKLDIGVLNSSKTFGIADLGCSVGPNTFAAVENIIEAVKNKYQSRGLNSKIPEFQVFFNDHVSNDFNLLFASLPQDKQYYAAGSPGSFYGRLFPEASLHIVHSSTALQWLSRVPKEIVDKDSPAWNKGKVHYASSGDQVIQAYKAQYEKDMEKFLQARAHEIVHDGLMLLILPFNPNGIHPSQSASNLCLDLFGYSLMDLAKKGRVSEEKVDSFNLPLYITTPQEFKAVVERNEGFSIERTEILPRTDFVNGIGPNGHQIATYLRAGMEGLIKKHFGGDIIDELFELYAKKADEILIPAMVKSAEQGVTLFAVLKRKAY
ncbi:loganic acid O-methyltransferase-like isoform X2 [Ziziphus jujuba]|uniref:Loganic acid O-methyltransferase-like isoform X2 n=1 Tax=Ziziphus jujuba TaxID=326968 RepID=A0ABM3IJM5_ZIZJJ|nr:loganic acid O-methyltransferase-like isoform X2 [Ziziphus jujuba]